MRKLAIAYGSSLICTDTGIYCFPCWSEISCKRFGNRCSKRLKQEDMECLF